MKRTVIKRDGTEQNFQTQKIINAIFEIINGLEVEDDYELVFRIMKELDLKVPERVSTEELDQLVLKAIEQLIPKHPIYDTLATRQLLKIINKRIDRRLGDFGDYLDHAFDENLLDERLKEFDLDLFKDALNYERDGLLDYFGLSTLKDRYLMKNRDQNTIEKPQWFFMRVAMGIGNSNEEVVKVYNKLSKLEYLHSTPTLFNSGTPVSQYSSCYVSVIDDSLDSIMDKARETAFLAKYAGGVGTDVSRIRATGSPIKSLNAQSSGVIPFIKIFDTLVNSIQQGGRRRSSQVISMQPWHLDIDGFLDLRETTGNAYFRTPSLNTKLWMPDEMMRRIEQDEPIYLFDPGECPELVDAIGDEFKEKYEARIEQAEAGKLNQYKRLESRNFYKKYLFKLAKTGHPWLIFKDEHNRHNPCPEYSVINSSNLCTEISIPNRPDSTAVCTLASVNLSKHLNEEQDDFDWDKLEDTLQVMVRGLDNILDKNFYPSDAARKNTMDLRPLGIGVMGFAEALVDLGIAYDSEEAVIKARKLGSFMREVTYETSQQLAEERGAFDHYQEMEEEGNAYDYKPRRNAVLMAIAPTASISIISGTTSSIDSYFSNLYSRDTLSGKHIVINRQLIEDLEEKGYWSDEMAETIKANNGSVQYINELEGVIDKDLYKTAYEIAPKRQIDIAAAFQESIDQAVSKSLYIDERLRDDMEEIYLYAWKKKLKSTYYCFIDKVIKGEKYTSEVNKRGSRKGFGGASTSSPKTDTAQAETSEENQAELEAKAREKYGDEVVDKVISGDDEACPTDPMLNKICPSCE
ncbi:ribonucleoside-diphosphate reductase subunit alpha [Aliifodinibius sp. S!AR15-10]|uniref:ribonucleoside-diphosphate reductase subunit alpha n=1 Tax=Aliifodinibius sp. S!AR15-10 TaxID=2950437 RepID=UPI002862BE3C|nr:ribonucleoside-diphosphate reductase subunit alpha [Aliifodinibius sp. S!AR15-10]MDR8391198.1 ribonucleoside-diphosphate reductase subunit alpha [Aliifodinibius sp. S!AR15-10]